MRRTSWARVARGGRDRLPGRETDRGPGGDVAQVGRDGRRGRAGAQRGGQRGVEKTTPRRVEGAAELLARPGQPAAERAGRASESSGGLVEGEALEVAEDHRQSGRRPASGRSRRAGPRPARGRARTARPAGRRLDEPEPGSVASRVPLFVLAPAIEPCPGLARRAERHAVEPGAEPVGIADGEGLAGEHEEDGLEGVLGVVLVTQELSADAQDHRPVARHQRGEGVLGRVAGGGEPLQELPVGEPATEPPSKSDSICRTIEGVVRRAMVVGSPVERRSLCRESGRPSPSPRRGEGARRADEGGRKAGLAAPHPTPLPDFVGARATAWTLRDGIPLGRGGLLGAALQDTAPSPGTLSRVVG